MICVFIADDHAIVRQGLKQIVSDTADIRLAGEVSGYRDLRLSGDTHHPSCLGRRRLDGG